MKKKRASKESVLSDLAALRGAGYYVKEFSDVHWRIREKSGEMMDIWPTSRKLMLCSTFKTTNYTEIVADTRRLFLGVGKPIPLPRWWKKYQKDMEPVYAMREKLAKDIDELVKNARMQKKLTV